MFSLRLVILLISFVSFIEATPSATPSYSNNTSTGLASATTPVCCFVVQDTVTEEWFQETSYSTTASIVNLTSITTFITAYPNTTKTAYETHVYTVNHTFNFSIEVGINPITLMTNDAPGPAETTIMNGNGTAVITGGMTLPSPGAFYVYNTVKIITAAAVTDTDGHPVCGTASSFPSQGGFDNGDGPIPTFTNMNENAQAYFGGLGIVGQIQKPTATITETFTDTLMYTESAPKYTSTETNTFTDVEEGSFYTNSKGEIVTPISPSAVVISLVTPFVYAPSRGANGETGEGRQCLQSGEAVNYGHVPQTLIDFLASNEQYKAQYPGIESCLPGGPSILQLTACSSVLPTSLDAGGDLTSGTIIYVTPEQDNQPTTTPWSSTDTYPTTQHSATQLLPSTDTYPTTQQPATNLISTDTYPTTQMPATQLQPTTEANAPTSPAASDSPTQPAGDNSPPAGDNSPPAGQSTPIGSIIASFLGGSPGGAPTTPITIAGPTTIPVASAPAGLIGSTTTISGTPFVVVPAATTISPAAVLPSDLGTTTTINGTPFLVIPSATTIPAAGLPSGIGSTTTINGTPFVVIQPTTVPLPSSGSNLPGEVTVISGTTELVIPGPTTIPVNPSFSVSGVTTVVDGTTEVIVSGATTVPITPGPSDFVQASGAAERGGMAWWIGGLVLGAAAALV